MRRERQVELVSLTCTSITILFYEGDDVVYRDQLVMTPTFKGFMRKRTYYSEYNTWEEAMRWYKSYLRRKLLEGWEIVRDT